MFTKWKITFKTLKNPNQEDYNVLHFGIQGIAMKQTPKENKCINCRSLTPNKLGWAGETITLLYYICPQG